MKQTTVLLFMMVSSLLFGQETVRSAPNPQIKGEKGKIYLLEGLVLVKADQSLKTVKEEHGIHVYLDDGNYESLKRTLEPFLNHPITAEEMQAVKREIIDYFHREKGKYVAVLLPAQDVTDGIVVFQVLPGTIGEIRFRGQKSFSEKTLSKSLNAKVGDPIVEEELMNYLAWVNRNPFHSTQLILAPGKEKGKTDIDFVTSEKFPLRAFTGSDNTGTTTTNQYRLYGGVNWGNALKAGDLLSYQYTASPNFHQFQSHVLSYTSFLPWKHAMTLFGTYGIVYPQIPDFTTEGKNIQVSGRYSIPFLPLYGLFLHYFDIGFDWKYITSNLFFGGDPAQLIEGSQSNDTMNVTQFSFAYGLQKNWGRDQVLIFKTTLFASVWKDLLPHQSTAQYDNLRPNSHVRYGYLKASLNHRYKLASKCVFSSLFRGQLASSTLPTSEQFGLGGADTVRGYYEQQFVADNALLFNFEFYSPPLSLFNGTKNEMTFLVFFDYGYGRNYSYTQPSFQAQNLFGIGPGVRYDIVPYFSLKMDYGFQLKGIPQDHRTGRFHFSINVSN